MPIYEYECLACGTEFEALQKVNDPPPKSCECGAKGKVQRKMSLAAFHLQGGGWYKDLYGGGTSPGNSPANGNGNGNGNGSPAKSESKTNGSKADSSNGSGTSGKSESSGSGSGTKSTGSSAGSSGAGATT